MNNWKKWPIREKSKDDWPKGLNKIKPLIKKLYYRGEWGEELLEKSIAVVGSRRMTRYGREVVDRFVTELVANGVTIISGFMYGVDSQAHRKSLEIGGKTIAVFGGGLDCLTPIDNDWLYSEILEKGGLVISEYENNFQPTLWTFPQRNRIVAGLSTLGVLVVEAGIKSGSLITARLARQQGKQVWAVPGMIDSPTSEGTNYLIKNNLATMTTSPGDIVETNVEMIQENMFDNGLTKVELEAMRVLQSEASTIDELCRMTGRSVGEISAIVSTLTIRGLIEEEAGKIYLLKT